MSLIQDISIQEMEAYESLPPELREVFRECPRRVSVLRTMRLPGVKKAYKTLPLEVFCAVIRDHLEKETQRQA